MTAEIKKEIQKLSKKTDERFEALATDMADMRSDMTDMQGDVSTLKQDVVTLKQDVVTLKQDMSYVKGEVKKIDAIHNMLDTLVKRKQDDEMETAAAHHKLQRHEGWIHHIANETKVTLPA